MSKLRVCACVTAILLSLAVIIGLVLLAPFMAPIKQGNAIDFWDVASRVYLGDEESSYWGGDVYRDDEWYVYEHTHIHGSMLYRIHESELIDMPPKVLDELNKRVGLPEDEIDVYAMGYKRWMDEEEDSRYGLDGLLDKIKEAKAINVGPLHAKYHGFYEYELEERVYEAKWYWAAIIFELLFLVVMVWFVFWPLIRKKPAWKLALRLGLAPFLFFLPVYFGYAAYTFTSAGPSGGILYPFILSFFRGGSMTDWGERMMPHIPQILEPISPDIGSPMALSGAGLIGPIKLLRLGVLVFLATMLIAWGFKNRKKLIRKLRGAKTQPTF